MGNFIKWDFPCLKASFFMEYQRVLHVHPTCWKLTYRTFSFLNVILGGAANGVLYLNCKWLIYVSVFSPSKYRYCPYCKNILSKYVRILTCDIIRHDQFVFQFMQDLDLKLNLVSLYFIFITWFMSLDTKVIHCHLVTWTTS